MRGYRGGGDIVKRKRRGKREGEVDIGREDVIKKG